MGKISGLPDNERLAIIGYLAQEGVVREITAEVPLRKSAEFQEKYGIKPYIIRSDKKYSDQLRIYLTDPESAPPLLKEALDTKQPRLNDNEFIRELVDNYGFTFFSKQNSQVILEKAKSLAPDDYDSFLSGYRINGDFIQALTEAVQSETIPVPVLVPVPDVEERPRGRKKKKAAIPDSNAQFSEEQLLYLGWAGEEYLFKNFQTGTEEAFTPFGIDVQKVEDVIWYNQGYATTENWQDGSIGKGCDILVKTTDSELLIEVKSSRRRSPIFGMTSFEMQKMMECRDHYFLAKLDYLENLISGQAPSLRIFKDPYARFFVPAKMQKAVFFCD